jgi:hypothetical protein
MEWNGMISVIMKHHHRNGHVGLREELKELRRQKGEVSRVEGNWKGFWGSVKLLKAF